ncbi:MAG: hypothetical protein AAGB00_12290 [Planctomycetota bacterium]
MLRALLLASAIVFASSAATAADPTPAGEGKAALIEEVLRLTRAEELTRVGQLAGFKAGIDMAPAPIPADKKAKIIAAGEEIIAEVMAWPVIKKDFIAMYDKYYTAGELRLVIELCKDPKYKVLVEKQLAMVGPSMKIGQKYGKLMMPKMMQATARIMREP